MPRDIRWFLRTYRHDISCDLPRKGLRGASQRWPPRAPTEVRPRRAFPSSAVLDEHHRDRGLALHALGDTAFEDPRDPRPTMSRHRDEIRAYCLGFLDDLRDRLTEPNTE